MSSSKFLKSAIAGAMTLGIASVATVAVAQQSGNLTKEQQMMKMQKEKTMMMMKKLNYVACYGINAAYKNDCQSPGHSCAGQDSKARDPHAFVAVPKGVCTKIAGGSVTSA